MSRPLNPCNNQHPLIRALHEIILEEKAEIKTLIAHAGIGHDTLRSWFTHGVVPNVRSLEAVLEPLGYELEIVKK